MKFCKFMPKLSMRTFKNDCGYLRENKLDSRMPEVPLTKLFPEFLGEFAEARKFPDCHTTQRKTKSKIHIETIQGLSNWYNAHLAKMKIIQTYRTVLKRKENESFGKAAFYDYTNKFPKHSKPATDQYFHNWKVLDPLTDFKNYVDSVKSRQKDTYDIPDQSNAWKQYFEHTIPRWNDKLETHKEMVTLKEKYYEKIPDPTGIKNKLLTKITSEKIEPQITASGTIPLQTFEPELRKLNELLLQSMEPLKKPSKKIVLQKLQSDEKLQESKEFDRSSEEYRKPLGQISSPEKAVKEYFQKSPFIPSERSGNINNEILFDDIFGQYLPKTHTVKVKEVKEIKPKEKPEKIQKRKTKPKIKLKNSNPKIPLLRDLTSSMESPMRSMTPSLFLLTNDPKTFKKKSKGVKKVDSKMLVIGKKKRKRSSCDESLCDLTNPNESSKMERKGINNRKILVVESGKPDPGARMSADDETHQSLVNSIYTALRNSQHLPRISFKR